MSSLCKGGYLPNLLTGTLGAHTMKNFSSLWINCVVHFMALGCFLSFAELCGKLSRGVACMSAI